MTNRREFLQAGVVATALPLAMGGIFRPEEAAAAAGLANIPLYKAVFDERYAEGRTFGSQVGRYGVAAQVIANGDISGFFEELDVLWRKQPLAVAGLTQWGPMFVLERLGRERGLHVALKVEHRVEQGALRHVMSGPPETLGFAANLGAEGVAWPLLMAGAVAGCRANCPAPATTSLVTEGAGPRFDGGRISAQGADGPERIIHYYMPQGLAQGYELPLDGPLYSWVIAPRSA